ncbi:unnamed protein product [Rotaria sordida]|uniref:Uncharacterized protein n=1 Tax=Rotaria sordida TaxID=392033 RepID=A0A816EZF4_9BILA|nr:unnamed protein product [Rotaria sordida]CAF1654486.1 unnamed protein product [Rotaria sordida]
MAELHEAQKLLGKAMNIIYIPLEEPNVEQPVEEKTFETIMDEANQIFYISNQDSHSITQWIIGDYEPRNIYASIPGRPGNSSAQLFYPQGITLDRYGNLYTADSMNSRIQQMFCSNSVFGITIAGTGQTSTTSNELSYPGNVAFDLDVNLYVSDTFNSRIQKFQRIR